MPIASCLMFLYLVSALDSLLLVKAMGYSAVFSGAFLQGHLIPSLIDAQ